MNVHLHSPRKAHIPLQASARAWFMINGKLNPKMAWRFYTAWKRSRQICSLRTENISVRYFESVLSH
ncbi:MAG: hypothetical protein DMG36_15170 [Acidobacteria bacterium]|nr:MAG: hypothetical protein DMG36_15170 [Acidobacteriota bacterium]